VFRRATSARRDRREGWNKKKKGASLDRSEGAGPRRAGAREAATLLKNDVKWRAAQGVVALVSQPPLEVLGLDGASVARYLPIWHQARRI
jgi:hypothetical protein